MSEIQIPTIMMPTLVKVAARMGLSVPRLLEACDLDMDLLRITDDVIPFSTLNRFLEVFVEQSQLESVGLFLGNEVDFDYIPGFETFIRTSSTARDAIRVIDLFQRLSPFFTFENKEKDDEAWLTFTMDKECPEHLRPIYVEMIVTLIHRFAKIILGEQYQLNKLILGSRLTTSLSEYKKIFNAPIEAGATVNAVVIDKSLLDLPLQNALPQKNKEAEIELLELITHVIDKHGVKSQVLELMRSDIEQAKADIASLAKNLDSSVRGLQRKLKSEGSSFTELQLIVRMEYAMLCLSRDDISIEKVSDYLGFSNRRSFSRAFSQWYGASPSAYRKMVFHGSLGF